MSNLFKSLIYACTFSQKCPNKICLKDKLVKYGLEFEYAHFS